VSSSLLSKNVQIRVYRNIILFNYINEGLYDLSSSNIIGVNEKLDGRGMCKYGEEKRFIRGFGRET
jgi:hypothetical protein